VKGIGELIYIHQLLACLCREVGRNKRKLCHGGEIGKPKLSTRQKSQWCIDRSLWSLILRKSQSHRALMSEPAAVLDNHNGERLDFFLTFVKSCLIKKINTVCSRNGNE